MKVDEIIIKPVLTEKSTDLLKNQIYTFEVNIKANKNQIKNAIEKIYPVEVEKLKVLIRKGKTKRVGRRMIKKENSSKKIVFIKLKKGKLDIFPSS